MKSVLVSCSRAPNHKNLQNLFANHQKMLCLQLKTTFCVSHFISLKVYFWLLSIFKIKINQMNSVQWPSFIHKPFRQLLHLKSIQNVKQLSPSANLFCHCLKRNHLLINSSNLPVNVSQVQPAEFCFQRFSLITSNQRRGQDGEAIMSHQYRSDGPLHDVISQRSEKDRFSANRIWVIMAVSRPPVMFNKTFRPGLLSNIHKYEVKISRDELQGKQMI